ncbi:MULTISPECIES: cell wall hydrolase [Halocynthiibacter]|nr:MULTISPECIES: cell wall hydrolase [Halocynthiibacter]
MLNVKLVGLPSKTLRRSKALLRQSFALFSVLGAGFFATPPEAESVTGTKGSAEFQMEMDSWLSALISSEREALKPTSVARSNPFNLSANSSGESSFEYSRDWLASQQFVEGNEGWECLTQALYFEARGESVKGQFAVAEVILNRVASPLYPNSICEVVNQGTGKKFQCQFTYTCDGRAEKINEPKAHERVGKVAAAILTGAAPFGLTKGATHYHTKAVNPRWARKFPRTATYGAHHFYRQPGASRS